MHVLKAIKERRSIRSFKDKDIPQEYIKKIMEAAIWAPSAGNLQSRKFIIVKDSKLKYELTKAAYMQEFVMEAPIVIVACADLIKSASRYGERGRELYCLMDTAASIQNMLLEIHELGLGACWIGAFDEEYVKKLLKLPDSLRPIALIPVGYPDESPTPPPRVSIDDAFTII